jgi:hypothetical protein
MCFSATSSFVSGAIVTGLGGLTLRRVRGWDEVLFGSLPLLFGIHQLEEGVVWLWQQGTVDPQVGKVFAWLYVVFAQAALPALAPLAVLLIERNPVRRRSIAPFAVAGFILACIGLWILCTQPIQPEIHQDAMSYGDRLTDSWAYTGMYVIVTCAPLFLSGYPWMITFGVATVIGLIASFWIKASALTSIWCAFEALVSLLIYLHFCWRRDSRQRFVFKNA